VRREYLHLRLSTLCGVLISVRQKFWFKREDQESRKFYEKNCNCMVSKCLIFLLLFVPISITGVWITWVWCNIPWRFLWRVLWHIKIQPSNLQKTLGILLLAFTCIMILRPLSNFLWLDKRAHRYHHVKLIELFLTFMLMVHRYWGLCIVAST
jgi:hypothetical protein